MTVMLNFYVEDLYNRSSWIGNNFEKLRSCVSGISGCKSVSGKYSKVSLGCVQWCEFVGLIEVPVSLSG